MQPLCSGRRAGRLLCAALILWVGSPGLSAECPPVEVRDPNGNYFVPGVQGEIVYRRAAGRELALDAYVQQGGETRPGVIVVHGGNWTSGSRAAYVGQLLELLTEAGLNWFSVDYRLEPEYPPSAALDDLRAALEFVRCNAAHFRTDPERLGLLGEDTGGTLAALLASEEPAGVGALVTLGAAFELAGERERLSPLSSVRKEMPPILAIHGSADSEVPRRQANDYCRAVREHDGDCRVLAVPGGIHRAENWLPSQWGYKRELAAWLRKTLDCLPCAHQPHESPRLRKDIVFQKAGDLKMDAWIPEGAGPFPAVVLAHGGGWEAGDKVTYLTPLLEPLARAGFAWFSVDYRLTPQVRHPVQLDDLRRAIRFVRARAADFRVDPNRIALVGESASGQMALQVAGGPCPPQAPAPDFVDRQPCHVQAVVSFYGVYDLEELVEGPAGLGLLRRLFGLETLDGEARSLLRQYSPLHRVHAGMPPVLLIHGTEEFLWKQGVRLRDRLRELGVEHELLALEGAGHGLESWEGRPAFEHYKPRLVDWLKRRLAP